MCRTGAGCGGRLVCCVPRCFVILTIYQPCLLSVSISRATALIICVKVDVCSLLTGTGRRCWAASFRIVSPYLLFHEATRGTMSSRDRPVKDINTTMLGLGPMMHVRKSGMGPMEVRLRGNQILCNIFMFCDLDLPDSILDFLSYLRTQFFRGLPFLAVILTTGLLTAD